MPEKSIIEAVKSGDIEKYSLLVQSHSGKVFALARSLLKNREDAEEITQNVFLKAFKSLDNFRGDSKFSSFLYRICYNESINRIHSRKIDFSIDEEQTAGAAINETFYQIRKAEQQRYVRIALNKLPDTYRVVLTLFYLEEQSYTEITQLTGLRLSAVKVRLHRARAALAEVLNEMLKTEVKDLY